MDLSRYDIEITHHAFQQAIKRGISPDLIEEALQKGEVQMYGKHGVKFVSRGSKRTIICVGEMIGLRIKIFTLEEGN